MCSSFKASNKVSSRGSDCVNIRTTVEIHSSSKAEGYDSCKKMLLQQESTENVPKVCVMVSTFGSYHLI